MCYLASFGGEIHSYGTHRCCGKEIPTIYKTLNDETLVKALPSPCWITYKRDSEGKPQQGCRFVLIILDADGSRGNPFGQGAHGAYMTQRHGQGNLSMVRPYYR